MGETAADEKSRGRRLRARFGTSNKRDASKKSGFPKLTRQASFNAGDTDVSAIKAASEGYDPLILLRSCRPEVSGKVHIQKPGKKIISKYEEYWAEQRADFVLLYAEKPKETDYKHVDVTNYVKSMFCVRGCSVVIEKRQDKCIKVSKGGENLIMKFDTATDLDSFEKSLIRASGMKSACLSDFDVIAPIGKGAAGKVFLVRHKTNGRKMALKAIEKEESVFDSRSSYRHAVDERVVLGLTEGHESFVQLRYAFQTKRNLYLVTDFCDGGDLFFYLAANQCGLDEDRACFIVAEILLAIERLHELDIIYRDLKPENILLDAAGHVRIADFGLCKRIDKGIGLGRTGTICGTHSYVAPEMVESKSYGYSVDIFTIGVFLYHIMVGRPPFDASDMEDVKQNVKRLDEIQYYDDFMSGAVVDFLKSVLSADPETRIGCGQKGLAELRSHPFFANIDWDALSKKSGKHKGGLFTGGFEIPPGMEHIGTPNSENADPNTQEKAKADGPWYASSKSDDDHLLRNFDLTEWEGVRVDDEDDSASYGDTQMWPLFKFQKRNLDQNYIVGYSFASNSL